MFSGPLPDDEQADRDLREGLEDISPETLRRFVVLAVLIQVGLFAASLGVMLYAFRDQSVLGGGLVLGGLLVLALSAVIYRDHERLSSLKFL